MSLEPQQSRAYNPIPMVPDMRTPLLILAAFAMAGGLAIRAADSPKHGIAHRGASSYAPEHTRAAYQLALDQKIDYVEQDLAVTRDGVYSPSSNRPRCTPRAAWTW
jgi:hypothetical protein